MSSVHFFFFFNSRARKFLYRIKSTLRTSYYECKLFSSSLKQKGLTLVLKVTKWGLVYKPGQNHYFIPILSQVCTLFFLCLQYEKTQTVLSELKLKFEMTEQEKQSITDELKQCKDNLKLLREKGNNVSLCQIGLALIERKVRDLKLIFIGLYY